MDFSPNLSPKDVIQLGSFGGIYFYDNGGKLAIDSNEFPRDWFEGLDESQYKSKKYNRKVNYFKIKSGLSQEEWEEKGWINEQDPRGWFQWYCRYSMGRRIPKVDITQIKRWKNFRRHVTAIEKNCEKGNLTCRRRQRQAILQWAYNPHI